METKKQTASENVRTSLTPAIPRLPSQKTQFNQWRRKKNPIYPYRVLSFMESNNK